MNKKRVDIETENWYLSFKFLDDLTTVEVLDTHTMLSARAHALRNPYDRYDEIIGMSVAYNRALQRIARKNEKYFIKLTRPVDF